MILPSPACLPPPRKRCNAIPMQRISAAGSCCSVRRGGFSARPFMPPSAGAAFLTPAAARAELPRSDNWSVGPGVIYRRRQLLAAGGFDETMGAFGDGLMVQRLALESGFCFDPALVAAWEIYLIYPEKPLGPLRAVGERKHQIDWPCAAVGQGQLSRRYSRCLCRPTWPPPAFQHGAVVARVQQTGDRYAGLTEVLQFGGAAQRGLEIASRLPLARFAVLAWAALVLCPYAIGAVLVGYWRATKTAPMRRPPARAARASAPHRLVRALRSHHPPRIYRLVRAQRVGACAAGTRISRRFPRAPPPPPPPPLPLPPRPRRRVSSASPLRAVGETPD